MININDYIIEKLHLSKDTKMNGVLGDIITIISTGKVELDNEILEIIKKWLNGYNKDIELYYCEDTKFDFDSLKVSDKIKLRPMKYNDWLDCLGLLDDKRDTVYNKDDKRIWQISIDLIFSPVFTSAHDYGLYFEKAELN